MKLTCSFVLFLLAICAFDLCVSGQVGVPDDWRQAEAKTVTLYSRTKHERELVGYGRSTFSFRYGLRSDDADTGVTRNNYELQYGGMNLNGDSDWFGVTMVTDDRSRIKDLGELNWSDILEVPKLSASPEPQKGVRLDFKTKNFDKSSNGQVSRAVAGHMYLVHSKDSDSDFYTLFRVEKLTPSDQVTISWKNVPAPL